MTGGTGPTSGKQVSNAGSQFGNAWAAEHPAGYRSSDTNPGPLQHPGNIGRENRASATCTRCGAWRGELGSEGLHDCAGWATGQRCGACFVCHLVEVFAAVRRVLRKDGVCLVNLGDCYNSSPSNQLADRDWGDGQKRNHYISGRMRRDVPGLKPKDLVGIPWRVALAMQAAGWWLRSDIIWSKPNPMPESVTDRPTRSHEYVFLFTKAANYFWDSDSIREAHVDDWHARASTWRNGQAKQQQRGETYHGFTESAPFTNPPNPAGRNARSVWTIPTHAYSGAHFATFAPALVRRCILAGSREGDTVLDPFAGSGTSLVVARQLGRVGWGIELNADYVQMSLKRLQQHVLF